MPPVESDDLPTQIAELHTDVRHTQTAIIDIGTDLGELRTEVRHTQNDIVELKTDVAAIKTDIAELRTDVRQTQADIVGMKTDLAELRTDVRHTQAAIIDIRSDLRATNERMDELGDDLSQKIDKLKNSLQSSRIWALALYVSLLLALAKGFKWL